MTPSMTHQMWRCWQMLKAEGEEKKETLSLEKIQTLHQFEKEK